MALATLAEVKAHLNMPVSDTTYDAELQIFLDAATPIVEYIVGPIEPKAFTEIHDVVGRSRILLRKPPIISITSIFEYDGDQEQELTADVLGVSSSNYGYTLDSTVSGLLVRRTFGFETGFLGQRAKVTYQAGLASVPADVKLAALEDIRALWQQTQQAARPQFGGGGVVAMPDTWEESMNMFPRLAYLTMNRKRTQSIA